MKKCKKTYELTACMLNLICKLKNMFYWLLYPLRDDFPFLRIFGYVSFRAVLAALTALVITLFIGPRFFKFLQNINFKENIRDDGPQSHHGKAGTPTMGGLLIIISMCVSLFFWASFENIYVINMWICTVLLAAVGFIDDYTKATKKGSMGLSAKTKLAAQLTIGTTFAVIHYTNPLQQPALTTELYLPFLKEPLFNMGIFAIPFWVLLITGFSNAVNLTDGLDGLATGLSLIVLLTISIIVYITGVGPIAKYLLIPHVPESGELTIFFAALIGACIGFLWYNSYPAQIFMGDTGSLALGGAIAMGAIAVKREVLLFILGGIFVAETLSVIMQVSYFKMTGKRIFKMAPLHHHYELLGWHENKVVVRFWIIGALLALISLSSLKII